MVHLIVRRLNKIYTMWVWIGWFCSQWVHALCNNEVKLAMSLALSMVVCVFLFIRQWLLLTSRFKGPIPTIQEQMTYYDADQIPYLVGTDLLTIFWIVILWAYDIYEIVWSGPRKRPSLRKVVQAVRILLYTFFTFLLPFKCTPETVIWEKMSNIIAIFATVLILLHCRLFCTWKPSPADADDPGGDFARWMGWAGTLHDESDDEVLPMSRNNRPRR